MHWRLPGSAEARGCTVFTRGIGEHAAPVRRKICANLQNLETHMEESANTRAVGALSVIHQQSGGPTEPIPLLVIRTIEELAIARQTRLLCQPVKH